MTTTSLPPHLERAATKKFHPLFPASQAFLWLPGLAGKEVPFCSYNMRPCDDAEPDVQPLSEADAADANGAPFCPPFQISTRTFVAWDERSWPAFPYYPIPIRRTLAAEEIQQIGRRVLRLVGLECAPDLDPLQVLKNDYKCYVFAVLSRLEMLTGTVHDQR